MDTEDDPVGPITPSLEIGRLSLGLLSRDVEILWDGAVVFSNDDDDIEDDWTNPLVVDLDPVSGGPMVWSRRRERWVAFTAFII